MEEYELDTEVAGTQIELLMSYCRSFAYYRGIRANVKHDGANTNFWRHINNVCIGNCLIEWCKIFGSYNNESHWKHTFTNYPGIVEIISSNNVRISQNHDLVWEEYHSEMRTFRDTHIAHRNTEILAPVPHLDCSFDIASEYYTFVLRGIGNPASNFEQLLEDFTNEVLYYLEKSGCT